MADEHGYRVRLRIKLAHPLGYEGHATTIEVAGRSVKLRAQKPEQALSDGAWVILQADGFDSEESARQYGIQLRSAAELAGLCCGLGVDVGLDKATSGITEAHARQIGLIEPHQTIRSTVHGLQIVPDDDNIKFFLAEATMTGLFDPDRYTQAISELAGSGPISLTGTAAAVRLLNLALLNTQTVASIVLATSAVDHLGQQKQWTDDQKDKIDKLMSDAKAWLSEDKEEDQEVLDALSRLHRTGLMQGVSRLLAKLGLGHLKKEWSRIYGLRSALVPGPWQHGETALNQLAIDTFEICARIVLKAVEKEGVKLPDVTSKRFPDRGSNGDALKPR